MCDALVFGGARNLNFWDIRANVARIPEVIRRVREAQEVWDDLVGEPLSLMNTLVDREFGDRSRDLLESLVQMGLLDRYLNSEGWPEFVLCASESDPVFAWARGELSFVDLVCGAWGGVVDGRAVERSGPVVGGATQQSGADKRGVMDGVSGTNSSSGIFHRSNEDGRYARIETPVVETSPAKFDNEFETCFLKFAESVHVRRIVLLGPGNASLSRKVLNQVVRNLQVVESIESDPKLSWFWPLVRDGRLAIAN